MITTNAIIDYLSDRVIDPIPRFILLKEILKTPPASASYTSTYEEVKESKWYLQLKQEQWEDGSWGRFHTQDTKAVIKQTFPTTESAIQRMLELSLELNDPMVAGCIHRMECYLDGSDQWPDTIEKHHGFIIALNSIVASNLSLLIPDHPLISNKQRICAENITKAFHNGIFMEDIWTAENKRSNEIYLNAYMVHPARLLQSNPWLSEEVQRKYLKYLWYRKEGIYYISGFAPADITSLESKKFITWLSSLEALSGFSLFPEFMQEGALQQLQAEAERLMTQEVNLPTAHPVYGHYSESWRIKDKRSYDLLLRILRLLMKCEH